MFYFEPFPNSENPEDLRLSSKVAFSENNLLANSNIDMSSPEQWMSAGERYGADIDFLGVKISSLESRFTRSQVFTWKYQVWVAFVTCQMSRTWKYQGARSHFVPWTLSPGGFEASSAKGKKSRTVWDRRAVELWELNRAENILGSMWTFQSWWTLILIMRGNNVTVVSEWEMNAHWRNADMCLAQSQMLTDGSMWNCCNSKCTIGNSHVLGASLGKQLDVLAPGPLVVSGELVGRGNSQDKVGRRRTSSCHWWCRGRWEMVIS